MIKTTLLEVLETITIMDKIIQQPLQGSLALKVARLAREANKEIETFYEVRYKILNKYCEHTPDGKLMQDENGNAKVKEEFINQCNDELQSLINTVIQINAEPLPCTLLDHLTLTAQEASQIQIFFE